MSYVSTSSVVCLPERGDLGGERGRLVVVQQRERVRRGAGGRDAVRAAGREVGRVREPGQVGRPGGGDGGALVGPARAHLDHAAGRGRR